MSKDPPGELANIESAAAEAKKTADTKASEAAAFGSEATALTNKASALKKDWDQAYALIANCDNKNSTLKTRLEKLAQYLSQMTALDPGTWSKDLSELKTAQEKVVTEAEKVKRASKDASDAEVAVARGKEALEQAKLEYEDVTANYDFRLKELEAMRDKAEIAHAKGAAEYGNLVQAIRIMQVASKLEPSSIKYPPCTELDSTLKEKWGTLSDAREKHRVAVKEHAEAQADLKTAITKRDECLQSISGGG